MPLMLYRYTQEFDDVFEDAIDESRRRNRGYGYSYDYAYGLLDVMHHNKWKLDCPGWIAKEAAHETV